MVADTTTESTEIGRLHARCRRLGITHERIAAACEPPVTRNAVCMALNEKTTSRRIVAKARELADQAERALSTPPAS